MTRKPIWVALGAVALLAVLAGALVPWTLSGASIRRQLGEQIRSLTGLTLDNAGRTTISVLPRPRIKIEAVELRDPDGTLSLDAHSVRGDLRILPLFLGRIEVASIQLRSPTIFVDIDGRPMTRQGTLARAAETPSTSAAAAQIESTRLGVVTIESGQLRLQSRTRGLETLFESVDMTLDWRSLNRPASLVGTARWSGHPLNLSAWLGSPAGLLRGEPSAINLKLESDATSLLASGTVTTGERFAYTGKLTATTTTLPAIARILQLPVDLPYALSAMSVSAKATIAGRAVDLSEMRLSLGGSDFDGSLAFRDGGERPLVSATLATDLLVARRFIGQAPDALGADGRWSRDTLPFRFDLMDLDLRISANRAKIGRFDLSDAALAVMVSNDRAEFSVGDAKAYGGSVKLRVSANPGGNAPAVRAAGAFTKVDVAALLLAGWHIDRLSGSASGQFAFDSIGANFSDIAQNLSGDARLTVSDGEISGVDLEQALRRMDKRPLSIGGEMRSGRTGFASAAGTFAVSTGVASLQDFVIDGPGTTMRVSGAARIADRALDLNAIARQSGSKGDGGPQLRVDIKGSFDDPHLVLDAASLIRRSEAAAPLFGPKPADDKGTRE